MPIFALLLLATAAPQSTAPVELQNVTVQSLGPKPSSASGLLWVVRELIVSTESGEQRTLYLTWFGKGDVEPAAGTRCDVSIRHWSGMSATVGDTGTAIQEGDAVDTIKCGAAPAEGRS